MEFLPLPDLCSLRILAHLPPSDLLGPIPLVSRAWNRLAREACRRTHSIILTDASIDDHRVFMIMGDYMMAHSPGVPSAPLVRRLLDRTFRPFFRNEGYADRVRHQMWYHERLVDTFPNITSLEMLFMNELFDRASMLYLLDSWAPRLTRLSIWVNPWRMDSLASQITLVVYLRHINRLKSLRQLIVFFGRERYLSRLELPDQLERLDLSIPCPLEDLLQDLIDQSRIRLKRISFSQPFDIDRAVEYLAFTGQANQFSAFARAFSHLRIVLADNLRPAHHLVDHFRHLRSLELSHEKACPDPLQTVSYQLSLLSELHTLVLHYSIRDLTDEDDETRDGPPWYSAASVRVLILKASADPKTRAHGICGSLVMIKPIYFARHNWLRRELNPAVLFPDLESVTVNADLLLSMCGECHPTTGSWPPHLTKYRMLPLAESKLGPGECLRRILEPFNDCFSLKDKLLSSHEVPNDIPLADEWTWTAPDPSRGGWW